MLDRESFLLLVVIALYVLAGCSDGQAPMAAEPVSTAPATPSIGQVRVRAQDEMPMVYVPAGHFLMGSTREEYRAAINQCRQYYDICNLNYFSREAPLHLVSISAYWIDQTEVTAGQYRQCVEHGACSTPEPCDRGQSTYADEGLSDHPIVCVDWQNAQEYCSWIGGRLPTEAEWEYASRGPEGRMYPWGNQFNGELLNYCDQSCLEEHADPEFNDGFVRTAPVGSFPQGASWVGALDLAGNVFEWVGDWFGPYAADESADPVGPDSGMQRILRGGSWYYHPARTRGAARDAVPPDRRLDSFGFRCVVPITMD